MVNVFVCFVCCCRVVAVDMRGYGICLCLFCLLLQGCGGRYGVYGKCLCLFCLLLQGCSSRYERIW